MGAPQTLPADFQNWDHPANPPSSLPADFNNFDEPQTSALSRFGSNLLSGLGVGSNEDAKNFFEHPINTMLNSLNAQGELAAKAKDAYERGDYKGAVIHGINYLLPFIGQQSDAAGQQLSQGDYAGGAGRTIGVVLPMLAGSPEARAAGSAALDTAASAGAKAVRTGARAANAALGEAPGAMGAALGGWVGHETGIPEGTLSGVIIGRELGRAVGKEFPPMRIPGEGFGLPNRVTGGPAEAPAYSPETPGAAGSMVESMESPSEAPAGSGMPRTLSGDSALRQILTGQDSANLMKIARSRGINVSQESQLRPSIAGPRLVNKIIDDFSPDELDDIRDQYIENTRMGHHDFGQIGPEAWKTMSLQSYFPDVKITQAALNRTAQAIKTAPRTIVLDPQTGQPEFSDVVAAKQQAARATPADSEDLTDILRASLAKVKKQ